MTEGSESELVLTDEVNELLTGMMADGMIYAPYGVYLKGSAMMPNENYTEKVSVNMNTSTLSSIDMLIDDGYYSNRSDFINQAVRDGLQKHQSTLDRIIDRNMKRLDETPNRWFIGVCNLDRNELEAAQADGKVLTYTGYDVLVIDKDIDQEMLFRFVKSIRIKGKVICSQDIKMHYGLK